MSTKSTTAQRFRKQQTGSGQHSIEDEMRESAIEIEDKFEKLYEEDPNAAFRVLSGIVHYFKNVLNAQTVQDESQWLLDRGLINKDEYRERLEKA